MRDDGKLNEAVRARPAAALRPFIAFYSGYRQRGLAPARHRGLPSPFLTLIFTLDEPLHLVGHVDPNRPPGYFDTLLGGLHTSPAMIEHAGAQSGVQVHLSPLGARALLGLPAGELTEIDVDAREVLGGRATEFHDRLRGASGWPERFDALDRLLGRQLVDPFPPVAPEVRAAWRGIRRTGGAIAVAELAREIGWSERHLQQRFRTEIGLTPKAAARVTRFDRARRALVTPGASVAAVAVECGYFDQSHLDREFAALAGCPPTRWLAEEFANIQARRPGEDADSSA